MRCSNGHLAHGTTGNPQIALEQGTLAAISAENERRLESLEYTTMVNEALVSELKNAGLKFKREDMVFVTRDKTGQVVWLERGNTAAGMEHIRSRGHDEQFARAFGIPKTEVERYLYKVVSQGAVVSNQVRHIGSRTGYERVYYFEGRYCVVTGIGSNGFIVSAYPRRHGKES